MFPSKEGLVNNRYRLHEQLGVGGMGIVYRATDRLNRQTVALKRLIVASDMLNYLSSAGPNDLILSLAREFELVASLRHPHIISVLDYGFDGLRNPYLVMEYLSDAAPIIIQELPFDQRIDLLLQVLQALAYLHRRGIIHCDVKPDNVLVQDGHVKLLDFGLSVLQGQAKERIEGTMGYTAPEVLQGAPVSVEADLYAVGILIYEMFAGQIPFMHSSLRQMQEMIFHAKPNIDSLDLPKAVADVLRRLLAKTPDERYASAVEALDALAQAAGKEPEETAAIRESFIEAAAFVGRENELARLVDAFNHAEAGAGSAWLIGGESGVGKTRLVEELRIRTVVRGALVLRGRGEIGAGLPYQLWREPVRRLVLAVELSDLEARILKEVVPDIGDLLGRDVPDAPPLEGPAGQRRLTLTIAAAFRRQAHMQPIVLLLEDLQWAQESLAPLQQLNQTVHDMPFLIIGNYRNDERPDLPDALPDMHIIMLERLGKDKIAELSASMLGEEAGYQQNVLELLQRETEGNVYFLVEVVRALAEEAGRLDGVAEMQLPETVWAGGVQHVLRRRLNQVPKPDRSLLKAAAVAGRMLDLNVLHTVGGVDDLQRWLMDAANVAVLEVSDDHWQFAHDKLRETLVIDMEADERRTVHRQVAEAVEAVYPGDPDYASVLVGHWHAAGHPQKELHYASIAAEREFRRSSFRDAVALFERALALLPPSAPPEQRIEVYKRLGDSCERLGDYPAAADHYRRGLDLALEAGNRSGEALILTRFGRLKWLQGSYDTARDYLERGLALSRDIGDKSVASDCLNDLGNAAYRQSQFTQARAYYEQSLALSRELGDRQSIAARLTNLGNVASNLGDYDLARQYNQQSLLLNRELGDRHAIGISLNNLGNATITQGDYALAQDHFTQSLDIMREIGSRQGVIVTLTNIGITLRAQGNLQAAYTHFKESLEKAEATGSRYMVAYNLHSLGDVAIAQRDLIGAEAHYTQSLTIRRELSDQSGIAESLFGLAMVALARDERDRAYSRLQKALRTARDTQAIPVMLTVVAGFAQWHSACGMPERSAELVGLALAHAKTDTEIKHTWLEPLQLRLEAALPAGVLKDALARGAQMDLEKTSAMLV